MPVLACRGNEGRGCRDAEVLTREVSEGQGPSESRSRAGRLWRASNPRRVGQGQGAGTPLVEGAGARKPRRSAEAAPLPHTSGRSLARRISAHLLRCVTLAPRHLGCSRRLRSGHGSTMLHAQGCDSANPRHSRVCSPNQQIRTPRRAATPAQKCAILHGRKSLEYGFAEPAKKLSRQSCGGFAGPRQYFCAHTPVGLPLAKW